MTWIIWSEEHGAWWRWGGFGYTRSLKEAGRYSEERAQEIVDSANRYLPEGSFNELMIPFTDDLLPVR